MKSSINNHKGFSLYIDHNDISTSSDGKVTTVNFLGIPKDGLEQLSKVINKALLVGCETCIYDGIPSEGSYCNNCNREEGLKDNYAECPNKKTLKNLETFLNQKDGE